MAWIESHQDLERHPKTLNLMSMMGWSVNETIGILHRFWWWCVDYAEDGDLRKYNDSTIASVVGLNSDMAKKFIDSMVSCGGENVSGFIEREPYFRIHDWWDYIGKFLQIKYKQTPERWEKVRKLYNRSKNSSKNSSKTHNQPIPTNLKQPIPTDQPLNISQNSVLLDSFGQNLKEKIQKYLQVIRSHNKTGILTEGRVNTLLNELFNTRERFKNDPELSYALDQAIAHDACNIGYINAILKNRTTKRPH